MSNPHPKPDSLHHLKSICSDKLSLLTRLSMLSFHNLKFPPRFEIAMILVSYSQLFSQTFLLSAHFYDTSDQRFNTLYRTIHHIAVVFSPGSLIDFNRGDYNIIIAIYVLSTYLILKYLLALYIAIITVKEKPANRLLLALWRLLFKLHGRVLYFLVTSFWVRIAVATCPIDTHSTAATGIGYMAFSLVIITLEYIFSLLIYMYCEYTLPTKNFLSSKNNRVEIITLTQKLLFQILEVTLAPGTVTSALAFAIPNVLLNIMNIMYYFKVFPYYNLKALVLEGTLLVQVTSLELPVFAPVDNWIRGNKTITMDYPILIWFILSPLVIKICITCTNNQAMSLLTQRASGLPEFLIHKIQLVKQFRKQQAPFTNFSENYEWKYLINTSFNADSKLVFEADPKFPLDKGLDLTTKHSANKVFLTYLRGLLNKFPKNHLIRLYTAYYLGRKFSYYSAAMKILYSLQQSLSSKTIMNASLLISETQLKLRQNYENNASQLNLSMYISNLTRVSQVKERLIDITDLHIKVCKEFEENAPDLTRIFNLSQTIAVQKKTLEAKTQHMFEHIPEYDIEPYIMYAQYHAVLKHSLMDYHKSIKVYARRYEKFARDFDNPCLSEKNLYRKENAFIVVSAHGGTAGDVTYSSKSAEVIYGTDVVSGHAYSLVPPVLQKFYYELFKSPFDHTSQGIVGQNIRTFAYHKEGFITEVDCYMNIHPFVSQGLYLDMVLRPTWTSKQFIILSPNGQIESYSKEIGSRLRLPSNKEAGVQRGTHIKEVSRYLDLINQAFNLVSSQERVSRVSKRGKAKDPEAEDNHEIPTFHDIESLTNNGKLNEARNLYSIFTKTGKILPVSALKLKGTRADRYNFTEETYTYHCKLETQSYGDCCIRVVTLFESEADEAELEEVDQLISSHYGSPQKSEGLTREYSSKRLTKKSPIAEPSPMKKTSNPTNFSYVDKESALDSNSVDYTADISERKRIASLSPEKKGDLPPLSDNSFEPQQNGITADLSPMNSLDISAVNELPVKIVRQKVVASKVLTTPSPLEKAKKGLKTPGWEQNEHDIVAKLAVQQSIGSQRSKSSAQGRIARALTEALTIKYHTKYYYMFIIAFYLLLASIFATQVALKIVLDSDLTSRKGGKAVMRNAETRNNLLIGTQRQLEYIWALHLGQLKVNQLGLYSQPISTFMSAVVDNLNQLSDVNNNLIEATDVLSQQQRRQLFESNVNVYDTNFGDPVPIYTSLNNFQAVERIIETGLKGMEVAQVDISAAEPYISFVFRNALNDILVVSEAISDLFLDALDSDELVTLDSFAGLLVAGLLLIGIMTVISILMIVSQYNKEKKHMIAFIRIADDRIKQEQAHLQKYKKMLQEDRLFDEDSAPEPMQFVKLGLKGKAGNRRLTFINRQNSDYSGIFRKYCFLSLKLIILALILVCFVTVGFTSARNSVTYLHQKLHQLFFSDRMRSRLNLAVLASIVIFLEPSTTQIQNRLIVDQLDRAIEDIKVIRGEIQSVYDIKGLSDDFILEKIIYEDGCQYMTGFSAKGCAAQMQGSSLLSLVTAASDLEHAVTNRYDLYQESNKSAQHLIDIAVSTFNMTVNPNIVLQGESNLISTMINNYYDQSLEEANTKSSLIFGITCGITVLVGLLAWLGVVREVREVDNRFKKVLQTLPPNLILSNFVLKAYLLKTCKGTLDFVRNDI